MKYLFYRHSIILLPAPNPPRNINAQDNRKTPPTHVGHPGRKSSPVPVRRPAAHPQSAGHVREQGRTTESQSSSILERPRKCPRGAGLSGRAVRAFVPPAAGLPRRRHSQYVSPGPPALPPPPGPPRPSLLWSRVSGLGRVLGEIVTSSALREAPFRREGKGKPGRGPEGSSCRLSSPWAEEGPESAPASLTVRSHLGLRGRRTSIISA